MKTYKYDRPIGLFFATVLFTIAPLNEIFHLISTGQSVWEKVVAPDSFIPFWAWSLTSFLCVFLLFYLGMYKGWQYLLRGYVFKLSDEALFLDGDVVEKSEILSSKITFRGQRIKTERKVYYFHPMFTEEGESDLREMMLSD